MTTDSSYLDINKLRPKKVRKEKERLYEEALQLKQQTNIFKDENVKLKTRLRAMERELDEKEDMIAQLFQ